MCFYKYTARGSRGKITNLCSKSEKKDVILRIIPIIYMETEDIVRPGDTTSAPFQTQAPICPKYHNAAA